MPANRKGKITIIENGPYLVSGELPLEEKVILSGTGGQPYRDKRTFKTGESYALCRCGKSKNAPFCDGSHASIRFYGTLTASKRPYIEKAESIQGPNLKLTDQPNLCAFARFCHRKNGDVWELTERSNSVENKNEAIQGACDCPAGRLAAWDKEGKEAFEPVYEPSLVILQDPACNCSGPLWVRGGVPIEAPDGTTYEVRNRVTLCRCGESKNKPFCDATHVSIRFSDKKST